MVALYILPYFNTGIFLNSEVQHKALAQKGVIGLAVLKVDLPDSLLLIMHK
jgi:hypothetical protein